MKLRMLGNSIRLRLTRSEVERFGRMGKVEETVDLGSGKAKFVYALETVPTGRAAFAELENNRLCIYVPKDKAGDWAVSDQVGIVSRSRDLRIQIEKDYACLTPRPGEDDKDTFENPGKRSC